MRYFVLIAIASTFILSCKKKEETKPAPEPTIELISISLSTVKEFQDSVIIRLKYRDNNGDLGDQSADVHSLQVKDSRLQNPDTFHVKPLAPISEDDIVIEGELSVKLNSLFLLGTGNSEVTTLSIKLKDRAGHWSNEVVSSPITINK